MPGRVADGGGRRSARAARTLSFWLPGVGQMYRGRWLSGGVLLAGCWVTFAYAFEGFTWQHVRACTLPGSVLGFAVPFVACTAIWLWAAYDAGRGD